MKPSTDPEPPPLRRNPLPKHLQLFAIGLVVLSMLSAFILAPDATTVLGSSWSPPASGGGGSCSYLVRWGDNLFRIGLRYGVTYQYLAVINGIVNPHLIFAGTSLSVPCGGAGEGPSLPSSCAPSETYVVNPGDNLFRIALNHGSTVDLIRSANNLWGRVLRPGMNLVIPCPGSVSYGGGAPPAPPAEQPVINPTPTLQAVTPEITVQAPQTAIPVSTVAPPQGITPQITVQARATAMSVKTVAPTRALTPGAPAPQSVETPAPVTINTTVTMKGNQFAPDTVQIPVGGRVTWVNGETDGSKHTVTCEQCPPTFTFDSGSIPIDPGKSFSVLFDVPGVFFYDSKLQPQMTGMIIVNPPESQ